MLIFIFIFLSDDLGFLPFLISDLSFYYSGLISCIQVVFFAIFFNMTQTPTTDTTQTH